MARPREFDEAAVLDAAMDCFWRNGYEATSVRDLATPFMGITGASLYNAFSDKRACSDEAFFRRAVTGAQRDGSVPPDRAPDDLARLLLGVTLGLRVLARSRPERELLEGMTRPALALLDWPHQATQSPKEMRS